MVLFMVMPKIYPKNVQKTLILSQMLTFLYSFQTISDQLGYVVILVNS